jgi:hypothetical protein
LGRLASLVATCKLNSIEPFAHMKATLEALVAGHRNADRQGRNCIPTFSRRISRGFAAFLSSLWTMSSLGVVA